MATTCFQWYHVVTPELLLTQAHTDGNNRQNDTSLHQDGPEETLYTLGPCMMHGHMATPVRKVQAKPFATHKSVAPRLVQWTQHKIQTMN
jgi:hypothetical protein